MQQSILFKVPGKASTSPVVILSALNIERSYRNSTRTAISRTLSKVALWVKCNCTPRRIVRALFSAKASTAVACICVAAVWWHNITIDNTIAAQEAVGFDCLMALPWGFVWAIRASRMSLPEEGGEL